MLDQGLDGELVQEIDNNLPLENPATDRSTVKLKQDLNCGSKGYSQDFLAKRKQALDDALMQKKRDTFIRIQKENGKIYAKLTKISTKNT